MVDASIMSDALSAMREAGLLVDSIEFDGEIHRFGTRDKPNSKNGWYRAFPDGHTAIYGNWPFDVPGECNTWTSKKAKSMTPAERSILNERIAETRKIQEAKQAKRHAEAATRAQSIYAIAAVLSDTTAHEYMTNKGVKSVPGLKLYKGAVLVPIYDNDGKVTSLQFIDKGGNKRFLIGGRKGGCFFPIGKDTDKPLVICEGLATGLSLHECLALPVLVAFDAGNLQSVAEVARARYPEREIILAADNDTETQGNPGVTKATAAAVAVGGSIAVPRHEGRAVDWNDLHQLMGAGEVRTQFMMYGKPEAQVEARAKREEKLCCVNVYDFLTMEFPERTFLLSPILPRQGLCMLHAQRGVGKTFISLSVAYAVASGGKVFNRWEAPQPARVLFIDGEMPARTMQERLASIIAGSDAEPPSGDYLRILTPDMQDGPMPNLGTQEGQEFVDPFLADVELVVIDNLATLARHGRSNDEESWLPIQGWLLELRRRGISVLMIHHQGKGGDQRGTSAKEDILDTVIKLSRPKDYSSEQGARFEVHLTKARGICGNEAKPFEAQLATVNQTLTWTTRDIEDAELAQLATLISEGVSIRNIAEEMGISAAKVQRLKKKLVNSDSRISSSTVNSNPRGEYAQ